MGRGGMVDLRGRRDAFVVPDEGHEEGIGRVDLWKRALDWGESPFCWGRGRGERGPCRLADDETP